MWRARGNLAPFLLNCIASSLTEFLHKCLVLDNGAGFISTNQLINILSEIGFLFDSSQLKAIETSLLSLNVSVAQCHDCTHS